MTTSINSEALKYEIKKNSQAQDRNSEHNRYIDGHDELYIKYAQR